MRGFNAKDFPTRLDEFRRREGISNHQWADACGIDHTLLTRYRRGGDFMLATLAKLLHGARNVTGRRVMAAELVDLGEDEPLPSHPLYERDRSRGMAPEDSKSRRVYATRLDQMLVQEGIRPLHFADEAKMSRQSLRLVRMGVNPRVSTAAKVVRTARRLTAKAYRCSDFWDIGE